MKNLKPIYVLPIAIIVLLISTFTFVACEKELNNPSVPVADGTMVSKKRPTGTSTTSTTNSTGNAYLDSLYGACNMVPTDSGLIYPTVILNNLQVIHRSIGGHDAIQISWDALNTPGKTVAGYYFAAGACDGRPDCTYHNNQKFSQVTTNTTGTVIVVQYGMSWLWTLNYSGCIHVLYTDNCMAMSQTFNFSGPQY